MYPSEKLIHSHRGHGLKQLWRSLSEQYPTYAGRCTALESVADASQNYSGDQETELSSIQIHVYSTHVYTESPGARLSRHVPHIGNITKHPKYKDLLGINVNNVNKSRQGEGFYSQTNLPGLIPRTRREKLLKKNL